MNFRNSGKMPLILVREFWNLVIEKSVKSQGILLFMICGNPVFVSLYLLTMLIDQVDTCTLHVGRYWSEVLCSTIMTYPG